MDSRFYYFLVPPLAWFVQLVSSYMLATGLCGVASKNIFHGITFFCLALIIASMLHSYRKILNNSTQFMITAFSSVFILVIAVGDLANFLLGPCP